ncbi:MAG: hypothetical protein AAF596_01935 [Planctomycetota bacterium]
MSLTEEIDGFAEFARSLAEQQNGELTLDDAYQKWKAIDPQEIEVLTERLASYNAGERGRPVADFLAEARAARSQSDT